MQVNDPKASEALRRSERVRPYLKGTLAPGAFVVAEEGRKEASKLLRDLGFSVDAECKLGSLDDAPDDDAEEIARPLRLTDRGRGPGSRSVARRWAKLGR
ncbi:MAG: hypothetical protein HY901_15140 [Deltaproteobacteria bacterium]|nr:hypothetical protein [Deltaproteobacteria bacterium]